MISFLLIYVLRLCLYHRLNIRLLNRPKVEDYESALYPIVGVSPNEKIWFSLSLVFIEDGELTVVESSVDDGVGLVGCLLLLSDDLANMRGFG